MILNKEAISQFEQRYRTAFVNSLAGFRQAVLVGTKLPCPFCKKRHCKNCHEV